MITILSPRLTIYETHYLIARVSFVSTRFLEHQSANRANFNTLTTALAIGFGERYVSESGDHSPKATIAKINNPQAKFLLAYPNALATKHTLIRVINEYRTAKIHR
jgi:hypothetical protein